MKEILYKQARKDVSQIFNHLLRRQIGTRWPTVEYLTSKEETLFAALKGLVLSTTSLPPFLDTKLS